VGACVVGPGDCLREIVAGQGSEQVADQKHGTVSETVGEFFDALCDFAIFEVAEAAIEVADLFLRGVHEMRDLLGCESDPPEHALISFHRERFVKGLETGGVLERG